MFIFVSTYVQRYVCIYSPVIYIYIHLRTCVRRVSTVTRIRKWLSSKNWPLLKKKKSGLDLFFFFSSHLRHLQSPDDAAFNISNVLRNCTRIFLIQFGSDFYDFFSSIRRRLFQSRKIQFFVWPFSFCVFLRFFFFLTF